MLVGVVQIGYGGAHVSGAARLQVGGHGGQLLRIASHQKHLRALRGPYAAGRFGNAGGGAEDQNLLGDLGGRVQLQEGLRKAVGRGRSLCS